MWPGSTTPCRLCRDTPETIQHIPAGCDAARAGGSRDQTDTLVIANQLAVVIDAAIPRDSSIRKKEHKKLEKNTKGLKEELEKIRRMEVSVVIGALGAVTLKLGEGLRQIPGATSEISVQKSEVLGTATTLSRSLKLWEKIRTLTSHYETKINK